ncbi:hypothetical protein GCM10023331_03340 [Algivirga pacifica]|uniref:PPM-type phosphatase domain-containing protein n=2 Tax=Algivirga pacifica TaxID=1162670 RepID=A0ABP9CY04_9BACT
MLAWQQLHDTLIESKFNSLQEVPSLWDEKTGYATYGLKVLLPQEAPARLALRNTIIGTSGRILINGKEVYTAGKVGRAMEEYIPGYKPEVSVFEVKGDTVDVVIQVANFNYSKGGIWRSIHLGSYKSIRYKWLMDLLEEMLLIGSLLGMGIYYLTFFSIRNKDWSALYYSLTCFMLLIRALVSNEHIICLVWPEVPWIWLVRTEFMLYMIIVAFLGMYYKSLFPKYYNQYLLLGVMSWAAIHTVIVLMTSPTFFADLFNYNQYIILGVGAYTVVQTIRAVLYKELGARVFLLGVFLLFVAVCNDILHIQMVIQTGSMMGIGFLVFIFCQGAVLSYRYSRMVTDNVELNQQLSEANHSLEYKVRERTEELVTSNEMLALKNQRIEEHQAEIEDKNEELQDQNEMLTQSIEYALRIQRALLPSDNHLKRLLGEQYFIFYRPRNIVSGDFYFVEEVDGKLIILVGDCTGHGVPGAFMSMVGVELLNQIVIKRKITNPSLILQVLHKEIRTNLHQEESGNSDGMDVAVCVIDQKLELLSYAGAKMSLCYIQDGQQYVLKSAHYGVGGEKRGHKREYPIHTVEVSRPLTIYLSSDGYQDQFGGTNNRKYMSVNFRKLLQKVHHLPLQQRATFLEEHIENWMLSGNEEQTDDILVMGIEINLDKINPIEGRSLLDLYNDLEL